MGWNFLENLDVTSRVIFVIRGNRKTSCGNREKSRSNRKESCDNRKTSCSNRKESRSNRGEKIGERGQWCPRPQVDKSLCNYSNFFPRPQYRKATSPAPCGRSGCRCPWAESWGRWCWVSLRWGCRWPDFGVRARKWCHRCPSYCLQ